MTLNEKAAYIKGTIDGMKLDTETNEGKLISLLSDLVSEMATKILELQECNETLNAYIEEIDEDLGELEEYVYDCEDDCCCSDDECCGCDCLDEDGVCTCEDDCDCCDFDDDYDFFETVCPSCNEKVYLDDSIDPSKIICPACLEEFSAATDN